jgi:tetratricopeptide (TPR) repeat protein
MKVIRKPGNANQTAHLLPIMIIAVVSFAVYANALGNGFIYDDHSQILKNHLIRDIRNVPEIFRRSAWTFEGAPPTSNYYRPMLNLFYMAVYYAFGLKAWGYHLLNILFHTGNSVLVFLVASRLLGTSGHKVKAKVQEKTYPLSASLLTSTFLSPPFVAGLLFATHPVHTEAVTWIGGLPDVSFAFFYLLSFYLYLSPGENYGWRHLFSVICFLLSALCKEPALTLPGILIAYDYAFGKTKVWSLGNLKRYAPYLLVTCGYFIVRFSVLGGFSPLKSLGKLSSLEYVINIFPFFSRYLYKLLLPIDLNFWPVYDPVTSLFSTEGMISLSVTVVFIGGIITSLKRNNAAFLCLLLIAAPLAPALYLKGIIGKLFAERYLYLPSFGFVMLVALLFSWIRNQNRKATAVSAIILILLIVIYSLGTITRNRVWADEYTLFADTVRKSPQSVVPRLEYGNALLARGRFDEAITQYQEAVKMEPMLYVIYHHLGLAFAGKNESYQAIQQLKIALALNPDSPGIHADLGRTYLKAGFRGEAVQELRIAVKLKSTALYHNLLGTAYVQTGEIDKAEEEFRTANFLEPSETIYQQNLAEASEILRSPSYASGSTNEFRGRFKEGPATDQDIFRFAW